MTESNITHLLTAAHAGDSRAQQQLLPKVYDELYQLASYQMRGESANHTLQPTALINEAYIKMLGDKRTPTNRVHFLAISAQTMRRILIDYARKKKSNKRGGDFVRVTLSDSASEFSHSDEQLVELNDALEKLSEFDPRAAKAIELMFFGGMTYEEIADCLSVARSTVFEDVKAAKAWLVAKLGKASR